MTNPCLIEFGKYYHVYNCGINGCELFRNAKDYEHFLHLYDKYIDPIAKTYAWCLMGNHFHLLVRIKENLIYKYSNADSVHRPVRFRDVKWETQDLSACEAPDSVKKVIPKNHFSHLFNSYTKYFNKKYNRHGSLFERPFERKQVTSEEYFRRLVLYIHNNPVHHGFCEHPVEYPWSSYLTCVYVKSTKLQRETVLGWFDDVANFEFQHNQKAEITKIEEWLGVL